MRMNGTHYLQKANHACRLHRYGLLGLEGMNSTERSDRSDEDESRDGCPVARSFDLYFPVAASGILN